MEASMAPPAQRICFVMMPFAEEHYYFFLFLKSHLREAHHITCTRADDTVDTGPFLDKVNDMILAADVIIADCSGRNPNVFYELGIAHAHGKKVILITHDAIETAPADVRHYEFIPYGPNRHDHFVAKLRTALSNVFGGDYDALYSRAKALLQQFNFARTSKVPEATKQAFLSRVMAAESTSGLPQSERAVARLALPRIIEDTTDLDLMDAVSIWLNEKFPPTP